MESKRLNDISNLNMYEVLPDGIIAYRIENNQAMLLYANHAALRIFECDSLEDMKAHCHGNYLEFIYPEDYRHHLPTIEIAWKNESQFDHHVQYRIVTKKNQIRFLNDHGNIVEIQGYQKCYICVITAVDRQMTYSNDVVDQLTGLLGMGQFIQYSENFLTTLANQGKTDHYHIAYFNIRHFKNYNVEYGSKKGDIVLKNLAQIIKKWSTTKVITRINGDQFVAISKSDEMYNRIQEVIDEFLFQYGAYGLSLDVGIYKITDYKQDIHQACDFAKIACDSIHNSAERIGTYAEELAEKLRLSNYITNHLNQAMQEGRLRILFQPIMRTITEALCGIEAMFCWEDSSVGLLLQKEIIPVLDESHQSSKVDLWLLEEICKVLKEREQAGKNQIPIAISFSHLDFLNQSFFQEVEKIVTTYSVPRDMLVIEINRSMIRGNADIFLGSIRRFQNGGYQICMDHVELSYSLLLQLKNDGFDNASLNMELLSTDLEQSKEVIASTIQLAKKLGISTIVKNVETKEQYMLLKQIGCDKIQGNYFLAPGSLQKIVDYVLNNQIALELRADRNYYDQISQVDLISDHPLAIVEYDQKNFKTLYLNEEFLREGKDFGIGTDNFSKYMLNNPASTLSRKFRYLQEHTKLGKEYAEMDFSAYGKYFRLRSRRIVENLPYVANQVEIINLSKNERLSDKNKQLDYIFRMMYSMHDMIFLLREDGRFENVMRSSLKEDSDPSIKEDNDILVSRDRVLEHIYQGDREEFEAFLCDVPTLKEKLKQEERGYISKYFRSSIEKGGYSWKAHTLQYIPEMDIVLYSTKSVSFAQTGLVEKLAPAYQTEGQKNIEYLLGTQLRDSACIGLFWKDIERRFLGANRKYLQTFGLKEEAELIGRRVEEFSWYVNDSTIKSTEEQVLQKGIYTNQVIERCIIDGAIHTVMVSKEPLYQNGKIVGLVGSIIDVDSFMQEKLSNTNTRDKLTGLLSPNGMLNVVSAYVEGWNSRNENFAVVRIEFLEQRQNYKEYGLNVSNQIARLVADTLKKICKDRAIIARLYAGNYSLLLKENRLLSARELVETIKDVFNGIHKVGEYSVSFFPEFEIYFARETEQISELIAVATGGSEDDLLTRIQLEDKLNYYDVQLETIIDAIPGGIAMYEVVGEEVNIVYASSGVGAVAGKTPEEFYAEVARDKHIGVHPHDREMINQATKKAIRENSELNVSYRLNHVNGTTIWVNMRGRIIGEQNGHPLLLVVFRNMSETSFIYESILDEALAGVFVSAVSDGEILYANKSAHRNSQLMAGGSDKELFQRIKAACVPEKQVESDSKNDKRRKYEIEMNHRNMLVYFADANWNGREACLCFVSDITAKYIEEREKATRESLLYLQAINASYDFLVTFNLTKNQYTMRRGRNFLGFDWSEYKSYTELVSEVRKLIPKEDGYHLGYLMPDRQIEDYGKGVLYSDKEHRIYDSEGKVHWVSDRIVYATDPANGDVLGISLSMLIDERVKENNRQKEMLEKALNTAVEASEAKSQFLSNMSHDIRTPMNAIMGYAEIASVHAEDTKKVREWLDKILASGNHLQELINEVLDVSRIEAGKEELKVAEASWDQFKRDIETITLPIAEGKEIDFQLDISEIVHKYVRADIPKIRRMAVNVIGNSIKFTKQQGKICCKITEQDFGKEGYRTYIIQVTDNGIGMSSEYVEHIFEMFSREHSSTESQISGTGLGMAITKKYAELMGGQVSVTSTQGKGTTVTMTIELELSEPVDGREERKEVSNLEGLKGKKILVVDDSDLNRDIVCMMLEEYGIDSDTATNGKEAVELLEKAEEGAYDYILMDMRMPVMDGVEAAKRIRASDRAYLQKVPMIALSANAFQEDVTLCLNAGMNDHISKPFTMEKLIEKLKNHT